MNTWQMTNCPQMVKQDRSGVPGPGTSTGSGAVTSGVARAGTKVPEGGTQAARKAVAKSEETGRVAHRRIARRRLRSPGRVPQSHQLRKVVFGHAYAIPAPPALAGGLCGKCKPAKPPVMVVKLSNSGPWCYGTGALIT